MNFLIFLLRKQEKSTQVSFELYLVINLTHFFSGLKGLKYNLENLFFFVLLIFLGLDRVRTNFE